MHLPLGHLLVDLENTIVGFGAADNEIVDALDQFVVNLGSQRQVTVVSNRRRAVSVDPSLSVVWRARKPFTARQRLMIVPGEQLTVVGDLPLTDGLLAWRLGVPFIETRCHVGREPAWPRLLRVAGKPIEWLLFRDERQ